MVRRFGILRSARFALPRRTGSFRLRRLLGKYAGRMNASDNVTGRRAHAAVSLAGTNSAPQRYQ